MIKIIIFLQVVLPLVGDHCFSEKCPQTSGKDSEYRKESKWREVMKSFNDLNSKLKDFPETRKKLDDLKASLEEQNDKDSCNNKLPKIPFEKVKKLFTITINSVDKLKSSDPLRVLQGVLDVVAGFTNLIGAGHSSTLIFHTLSAAVGVLFTESKLNQPSVVQQLTNVVRDEMINLNKRLHDQKFNGLKRRLTEQIFQVQRMKEGEKLDDPTLWNDCAQFLSELAFRFESPVPFKYEDNLTEDPDIRDFVTAVVQYSEAHSFFVALLFVAKGKYAEFKSANEDEIAMVDRKIVFQLKEAKEKLSFLSEKRFLTFLGRIDGGKLTKILALSRRIRDRSLVETVRLSLSLLPMTDLSTIDSSAKKVSQQEVPLRSVKGKSCSWSAVESLSFKSNIQFINDADFTMKVVSDEVRWNQDRFVKILEPRDSYSVETKFPSSSGGYLVLYANSNELSHKRKKIRVFEFAVSNRFGLKINLQDRTGAEFLNGRNAFKDLLSGKSISLYFSESGKYYINRAEIFYCFPFHHTFRFITQGIDPEAVEESSLQF